jgi:GMP synthase-like glutamine amidotransferase
VARVLILQHTAHEGLGRLQQWLPDAGVDVHPIHPYLGHRVPPSVEGDALIVLGGPMGANDDDIAPWLPATRALLKTAIDDGVPTLGICLGAQLLGAAAGGEVQRGALGPELGFGTVTVSQPDLLLAGGVLPVVQWHFDTVSRLPASAALLASSDRYASQAFRVGEVAWGLQFHLEATADMVGEWARGDAAALAEQGRSPAEVAAEVAAHADELEEAGLEIIRRFVEVVTG